MAKRDQKEDPFSTNTSDTSTEVSAEKAFSDVYRGVFDLRKEYKKGEMVTRNGSLWYCKSDHKGEFDHESFKLCAKEWIES